MLASLIAAALAAQFAAADTSPVTTLHCGHFIDVDGYVDLLNCVSELLQ